MRKGAAHVPFIQDQTTQNVSETAVSAADPDPIAPAPPAARTAGIKVVGLNLAHTVYLTDDD